MTQHAMAGLLLLVTFLFCPRSGQAQAPIETYSLENGLRVVLAEDHSTPLVTVDIWYNVGSANEQPGRSGFAHLLQYLMFQGSANVAGGEHYQLVHRAGGRLSASSSEDRTQYLQTLPSHELTLGLWLEADRMRSLVITDDALRAQRDRIREERRFRVDNQPYSAAFLDGLPLAFDSATCFPYAHSAFGALADLDTADTADIQAFFDEYYRPNNATLAVVGDFEMSVARTIIKQYFGDIPRGSIPNVPSCDAPLGAGARTHEWSDPLARLPGVIRAYRIPPHANPDRLPLALVTSLLGHGEPSRLHQSLVVERRTALQTGIAVDSRRAPGFLYLYAIASEGVSADSLTAELEREVQRLVLDPVSPGELDRARSFVRSATLARRTTTEQLAEEIQHFMHFHESLDQMQTDLRAVQSITHEEIRRVTGAYLTSDNSYTLIVMPGGAGGHQHDGGGP